MRKEKIGILDADLLDNGTRHPNLALMKLSGYFKEKKAEVTLLDNYQDIPIYSKVFISKVFSFTHVPHDITKYFNIVLGGTGFFPDGGEPLQENIEHHMPDYHLYDDYINGKIREGRNPKYFSDYQDFSIGFTTRGCFRGCGFCVNKKYTKVIKHSPVSEFLDPTRFGIYLWDDNFFGFPRWEEIFDELENTGKPFQFRQGLDIRLLTPKKAERLSKSRYHGDFIFAFDHVEDREMIEQKLALWKEYITRPAKLYVLCAFDSQDHTDIINTFERIKILMKYGALPYIMRYEKYKESKYKGLYIQLARWCNQPNFFKKKSFREFCIANQEYHSNQATNCSTYQVMIDFEKEYPDIAHEYFDLRYDIEKDKFGSG